MGSITGVCHMTYENRLEKTLEQVLPYYYRYFENTGEKAPALDPVVVARVFTTKVPALLQKRQGF